jgi:hypothetical protein
MSRWVKFLVVLGLSLAAGLVYGWVINPVQYKDVSPDALRSDYRTDYVLMVAEVDAANHNPDLAAQQLAILGSAPPSQIADQALKTAEQLGYTAPDLELLSKLASAMQSWQPGGGIAP